MRRIGIVPIALAIAVTIGCDRNDRRDANGAPVGTAGTTADNVRAADRDFVKDLAIAGMAEVELGRLAVEKAATPEVKKFGQMMIDDHTAAAEKLKSIASKYNIPVPTEMDDKHRDLRDDLAKKSGLEFERSYIEAMENGHNDVLDKLGSRVDKQKLGEWRTKQEERVSGRKTEERAEATAITPEPSDNPVTMQINQWAADAYPIVYGHHASAKTLNDTLKRRTTN